MTTNTTDWIGIPEDTELEKYFGFIYKITNLVNNRKYIGKKQLYSNVKRPPLKGMKKNRRVQKESDWRKYYGSSNELLADIEKHGKSNFKREVIEMTTCKWEAAWREMCWQAKEEVLFRDDYYNSIMNIRLNRPPKALKEKYKSTLVDGIPLA